MSTLIGNWFFIVVLLLCCGMHLLGHGHGRGLGDESGHRGDDGAEVEK